MVTPEATEKAQSHSLEKAPRSRGRVTESTLRKLVALVEAHLSSGQPLLTSEGHSVYSDRYLTVDFGQREVYVDGANRKLTLIEYALLSAFLHNSGEALSLKYLLSSVWGPECDNLALVRWHITNLRRKLTNSRGERPPIVNLHGYGYRYDPEGFATCAHGPATPKIPSRDGV